MGVRAAFALASCALGCASCGNPLGGDGLPSPSPDGRLDAVLFSRGDGEAEVNHVAVVRHGEGAPEGSEASVVVFDRWEDFTAVRMDWEGSTLVVKLPVGARVLR